MTSNIPDLGKQAAYRLTDQDRRDLRIIMAQRWQKNLERRMKEEADG